MVVLSFPSSSLLGEFYLPEKWQNEQQASLQTRVALQTPLTPENDLGWTGSFLGEQVGR